MRHFVNDEPSAMDKVNMAVEKEKESELAADVKPVEPEKPEPHLHPVIHRRGKAIRLVNFRKDPMPLSHVIDVVMIGSVVDILGSERDSYKIRYKGKEGYAKKYAFEEVR